MKLRLEEKKLLNKVALTFILILTILSGGSLGYVLVADSSFFDGLYMTVITVTTIGFGEIIDTSKNHLARIWTMLVALGGVSIITYLITNLTAIIVDGSLKRILRNRVMERNILKLKNHYLVCGMGRVGCQIIRELIEEAQPFVCADISPDKIAQTKEKLQQDFLYRVGDCTDEDILTSMGIAEAKGIFVATDDDNANLVICVAAKWLVPEIKIIALVKDPKHTQKLYGVGAHKVICPSFMGGMRMTNEMLKPDMAEFLDSMLKDQDSKIRLHKFVSISSFAIEEVESYATILGIQSQDKITLKPSKTEIVSPGDRLFVLCDLADIEPIKNFISL